jgi:branched-chain amino acid transport system substrate-binding protein
VAVAADTDEPLHIGYLLPETGPLADLGPAQISGLQLAIQDANEAGGVLGQEVSLSEGDEAGDTGVASEEADRLLADGVHAIVGAAASGMSLAIIDQITGAGVVQCSASNTAPDFTDYDDNGFYFRTAPSDSLQGDALAEVILEDGHTDVALLARADDYGVGLLEFTREGLEAAGANVVFADTYDPEAVTFDAEVSEMIAAGPDAIAIVPFIDDGVPLIQTLIEQGWDMNVLYGADGIRDGGLNDRVGG